MPTYNPAQIDPQLNKTGPRIQVEIGIPEALARIYAEQNKPIPNPVTGFALVDTGASITAVDVSAVTSLNITPVAFTEVHTPSTETPVIQALYPVSFSFVGSGLPPLQYNSVLGSPLAAQGIIALIGRDILANCILIYNGKLGHFSLSLY